MSKLYSQILTTDTFQTWFDRTNILLSELATSIVTTDTTSVGSLTTGNVHLTGNLDANIISVAGIKGGTNTSTAPLNIASAAQVSGSLTVVGAVSLNSALTVSGAVNLTNATVTGSTVLSGPTTISGLSLNVTSATTFNQPVNASITGNAATATKLFTPRVIALTGDIAGNALFDGSSNVSISTSISFSGAGSLLNTLLTVDGSGSGLDADLLDGLDSTKFLRVDQSGTIAGTLQTTGNKIGVGTNIWDIGLDTNGDLIISYNTTRLFRLTKTGDLVIKGDITAFGTP